MLQNVGVYIWEETGEAANYTNWSKGEPNKANQHCVWKTYQKDHPGWHNAICSWTNWQNGYGEQHALCQTKN